MKDLPFKDWVHMNDPYVNSNHNMGLALDPNASKADLAIMEEGWFVRSMPDMNLDNPYMLKYFQQWAVWWIEFSGLDGFRVDTWFYNEKVPMSQWAKAVTDEYPYFNIVGENWSTNPDYVAYWQSGNPNKDGFDSHLPSIMDFPLQDAISQTLQAPIGKAEGPRGRRGSDISAVYNALSHDFLYHDLSHMMIFLSNHDIARVGDTFGHDPRRMKIAYTLLATLRGIPQLFYGDEMMFVTGNPRRDDGRLRMDFPGGWKGDKVNLFTEKGRAQAAKADTTYAHAKELHDYARTLFNWRKGSSVIHSGKTLHFIPENNTYGYFRYNDEQVVFVFINNSDKDCTVPWTRFKEISASLKEGRDVITGQRVQIDDSTLVPAYSTLIIEYKL
jgi:glycosidase